MENALEKLKLLTAWETEPALTEIEVEDLLNAASIADENGNEPANDSWVPTFDLTKRRQTAGLSRRPVPRR